jgi:hypothetical protein
VPEPVFLATVDTEADDQWSLEGRKRLAVKNAACLPRLQALCDRFGVRPTYLITHEMATKPEASSVLKALHQSGRCEIGAHLHPWSSPPYREEDLVGRYPSQLPDDLLARQMRELTDAIVGGIGIRPVSYRAGRHGFDERNLQELEWLGYKVDSSVDPLFNERRLGGRAYAGAPVGPYHPDRSDVCRAGDSSVLEVPVSSATLPLLPKALERVYARLPPRLWRPALKRLGLRPVWLRPSYSSPADARALAQSLVGRGVPTLTLLFHSSELLPGGSPYYRDARGVDGFFAALESLFEFVVRQLGARPMTLGEYAAQRSAPA